MIYIGKSPDRVSLLGGGSDLDWFVRQEKFGVCLGYSLDKYSYSVLNVLPSIAKKGILEYSTREEYKNSYEIQKSGSSTTQNNFIPNYERGKYLVTGPANCGQCHSPTEPMTKSKYDRRIKYVDGKELSGVDAFIYIWERTKGYELLAKFVGLPVVKQLSKMAYAILAFLLFYKYKIFSK